MRKWIGPWSVAVGTALVVATGGHLVAQQSGGTRTAATPPPAEVRVGLVDLAAIQRAFPVRDEAVNEFNRARTAELDARREEIQSLRRKVLEGGDTLAPEARESLLKEIGVRQDALRTAERAAHTELQSKLADDKQAVQTHVKKVAAERGILLVLDASDAAVVWAASTIDLTPFVIQSMRTTPAAPAR